MAKATQVNLRLDEPLHNALRQRAEENGRSLNKEMNERLLRSINEDEEGFRKSAAHGLLRIAESAMRAAGASALFHLYASPDRPRPEERWIDDPFAYGEAVKAAIEVLNAGSPKGEARTPALSTIHDPKFWADWFLKQALTGQPNAPQNADPVTHLRDALGELAERVEHLRTADLDAEARRRYEQRGES